MTLEEAKREQERLLDSLYTKTVNPLSPTERETSPSYPYYRKKYALDIQPIVDAMLNNRKADMEFSCEAARLRVGSLYLRIQQSLEYLIDRMDHPDKRYAKFRKEVVISRVGKTGVKLMWRHNRKLAKKFPNEVVRKLVPKAIEVEPSLHNVNNIEANILTFIKESQPNTPFVAQNLELTPGAIQRVQDIVRDAGELFTILKLTSSEVKLWHGKLPDELQPVVVESKDDIVVPPEGFVLDANNGNP